MSELEQVIRDVARTFEREGFRTEIVVHGDDVVLNVRSEPIQGGVSFRQSYGFTVPTRQAVEYTVRKAISSCAVASRRYKPTIQQATSALLAACADAEMTEVEVIEQLFVVMSRRQLRQ